RDFHVTGVQTCALPIYISNKDVVVGIAASGTTPYVIGGLEKCNENNILTGCITCNEGSPLSKVAQYPIVVVVGPEFVTGSSRMKIGRASCRESEKNQDV